MTDENVKNHERLWENLVTIYKNRAELKKLLSEKDEVGNSFINLLVLHNTADVIEYTLNKFKENLSESDYQEILKSKGELGRNLLQLAAVRSKEVKTHQILWKELRDSYKADEEFLEMIKEVDENGNTVFSLATSFTTSKVFEFMEKELEKIASRDEIRKLFIKLGTGNRNLLQMATRQNKSLELHKNLWKILQKYFNSSEILNFVKHLDEDDKNLLILVKNWKTIEILEFSWKKVEKLIKTLFTDTDTETVRNIKQCQIIVQKIAETKDKIKGKEDEELLKLNWIEKSNSRASNLFHEFIQDALRNNLNVRTLNDLMPMINDRYVLNHEVLWENLLKTFENLQDLAKLLFEKTKNGNNFIHLLLISNNSADVIEFTLKKLKENLSESDYQKILRSKGQFGRNLLQVAACQSKEVKIHQVLWKTLQDCCKSNEEFLAILEKVDEDADTILNLAATFSPRKIFRFIQKELEKIASHEEIKKLLINLGLRNRNLLQLAACQNKSLKLNEAIWKIIEKYFNSTEIFQFAKHCDGFGCNVLLNVIEYNTKEVRELTWNNVRKIITIGCEKSENIRKCDEIMKRDKNLNELTKEDGKNLILEWIDNKNSVKLFKDSIQLLMEKDTSDIYLEDLIPFTTDENVENHCCVWKYFEESFKSYEELKELIFEKNKEGESFTNLLVVYNKADVIEFTINKLKENLSESDYKEILRSKGYFGRNLLQTASVDSQEVKIHQIVWKLIKNSCKTNGEFLEILEEVDNGGSNVLNDAATCTSGEIFRFMHGELEKIASHEEIKKLLVNLGFKSRNLLQSAAEQNKYLELHEVLWEIVEKYFHSFEILKFIKNIDDYGKNVLLNVIESNTNQVKDLTWNKVRKTLISIGYENNDNFLKCDEIMKKHQNFFELTKEEKDVLKLKWIDFTNSVQLFQDTIQLLMQKDISDISLEDLMKIAADENVENHKVLWKYLRETFQSYDELKKWLLEKDKKDNNFIHLLVISNTADVIEFTLNEFKENLIESDYLESLRLKGYLGRNLLQLAIIYSKEVQTHQILWSTFRDSCKTNEEFMNFLVQIDIHGNNVLHLTAACTTSEVFAFMINELKKFTNEQEIRKLLTSCRQGNTNLLQSVVIDNKSLGTNKTVWKIFCKYFKTEEILEFSEHFNDFSNNLLCCAVYCNTKEIVEFTWNQIKMLINSKDAQVEYFNRNGYQGKNLLQLSLENYLDDSQVADWVQQIMQEYEINLPKNNY